MWKSQVEFVVPVVSALGLVFLASAHQLQIDNLSAYRDSLLIRFEFLFLIVALVGLLVASCSLVVSIFQKNWQKAGFAVASLVLTFLLIALGMYIDSSTLIYMT